MIEHNVLEHVILKTVGVDCSWKSCPWFTGSLCYQQSVQRSICMASSFECSVLSLHGAYLGRKQSDCKVQLHFLVNTSNKLFSVSFLKLFPLFLWESMKLQHMPVTFWCKTVMLFY